MAGFRQNSEAEPKSIGSPGRAHAYFSSSRGSATRERGRLFLAGVGSGTVLFATSALFDAEPDLRLRVGVASGS